jgi:uncharacterized protein YdeI (YjbR/CyaY-like superfamily)
MDDEAPIGSEMNPHFFATTADFMAWLEANHETEHEVWIGFHKKGTGRPSITWPEAVDVLLCFGWIDGIRKSIDSDRYKNRCTPRRKGGNWSAVNIRRIQELIEQGAVRPAGLAAFEAGIPAKTAVYAYEQRQNAALGDEFEAQFAAHPAAWAYFQARPPWYRNAAIWWVISAKKEETRQKRLQTLIADSAAERPIAPLSRRKASS